MYHKFNFSIVLLASVCLLVFSTAQACMTIAYTPTPPKVPHYENIEAVFAAPPVIEIGIMGAATFILPKQNPGDKWEVIDPPLFGTFSHSEIDILRDAQPASEIQVFYGQHEGLIDGQIPAWKTVNESEKPLHFIYTAKGKSSRMVTGTLRVTRGKEIAYFPEIQDSVIKIVGSAAEGSVNSGRPYRIEWVDESIGRHQWQVESAIAEAQDKDGVTIDSKPIKVMAETLPDGRMVFRGDGYGQQMRIKLKATAKPGHKSELPKPVIVIIRVDPTPAC